MENFIGQDLGVHGNIVVSVGKCALSVAVVCSQADSSFGLLLGVWSFGDLLDSSGELVHISEYTNIYPLRVTM
jgi:hypothetical protein